MATATHSTELLSDWPFHCSCANLRAATHSGQLGPWKWLWPLGCTDISNKKFTTALSTEALSGTLPFYFGCECLLCWCQLDIFLERTVSLLLHISLLYRMSHVPAILLRPFFIPLSYTNEGAGVFPHYKKCSGQSCHVDLSTLPSTQLQ